MDKPFGSGGLEKRSAEFWEDMYWKSIKRYPEMNSRYMKQQEEIAELYQTIKYLTHFIDTLDGFADQRFGVTGNALILDFQGLRATLVRKQQYIETLKSNYQNAVQMLAELRKKYETPKQSGGEPSDDDVERRSLRTSKYL